MINQNLTGTLQYALFWSKARFPTPYLSFQQPLIIRSFVIAQTFSLSCGNTLVLVTIFNSYCPCPWVPHYQSHSFSCSFPLTTFTPGSCEAYTHKLESSVKSFLLREYWTDHELLRPEPHTHLSSVIIPYKKIYVLVRKPGACQQESQWPLSPQPRMPHWVLPVKEKPLFGPSIPLFKSSEPSIMGLDFILWKMQDWTWSIYLPVCCPGDPWQWLTLRKQMQ